MNDSTSVSTLAATALVATVLLLGTKAINAQQIFNNDLIVRSSECVGFDCANSESFGSDTIRLKENNLRIHFDDTSNSASFPSNDWRITANESSNGGANKFSIDDATSGRIPFTIEAGAPSHSLYVDDGGRIGLGTSTPSTALHIKDGNTPTLRLDQDGSSGFTPQTWDVAGNEASFFVRDATTGSRLPFRIRPGAPDSSIDIAADGDVGMGTSSPVGPLHVRRSGNDLFVIAADGNVGIGTTTPEGPLHVADSGTVLAFLQSTDNNAVQLRFKSNSGNRRFLAVNSSNTVESQVIFGAGQIVLAGQTDVSNKFATFNATGLTVNGSIATTGSGVVHPDYVFAKSYELMPLADLKAFIERNKHLPEIPSAAEVAANGLNITELQIGLLKKVEELTLYILKQQETIEVLEQKLAASADM